MFVRKEKKYVFGRNGQAYQQKTETFSVSEEKKFGKIDSGKTFFFDCQRVLYFLGLFFR